MTDKTPRVTDAAREIDRKVKDRRGNNRLRDGDCTYDECPHCGFILRVRRRHRGGPILWCPCGYEVHATDIGGLG